jgi:hypothetical protein
VPDNQCHTDNGNDEFDDNNKNVVHVALLFRRWFQFLRTKLGFFWQMVLQWLLFVSNGAIEKNNSRKTSFDDGLFAENDYLCTAIQRCMAHEGALSCA